jgi:hypothetical protein
MYLHIYIYIYIYIYIFSQVVEYFMLVWPGYDVNGFRI